MYLLIFKGTLRGKPFCVTYAMPERFLKDYAPEEFLQDISSYIFYNPTLWDTICHAVGNSIYSYFVKGDEVVLTIQKETTPKDTKVFNLDVEHINDILSRVYIFDRTAL